MMISAMKKTAAVVAAIACAHTIVSCGKHEPAAEITPLPPITAETVLVKQRQVTVFEEVVGTVRPRKEAKITAKLTGRILQLSAVPGKRVKAGEILAELEAGEIKAALDRAKAGLAQADRDLARYRALQKTGATNKAELEQIESGQEIAAASVRETQTMLENATVKAPFDGTITRRFLEPGDLASPARALFSMEDSSLLRLEINVAESLAGKIKPGDVFRVEVAGAGADFDGKVTEIAPSADVGSRTFLVKLDLPKKETLRAGQFGRAYLPRGMRNALRVPAGAVIARGQMDYLFIKDAENIARLRIVRTGGHENGSVEILSGLDDGEQIVLAPPTALRDGQPLENK